MAEIDRLVERTDDQNPRVFPKTAFLVKLPRMSNQQLVGVLALALGACSSSAGAPQDAATEAASDGRTDAPPLTGDDRPAQVACEVALDDVGSPCAATVSQAQAGDAGWLLPPCGTLDRVVPPTTEIFFGTWDCFYDMSSGALVGWDRSSDIPEFCSHAAAGLFAGNVPLTCSTFLNSSGWRRAPIGGDAGGTVDAAAD